MRKFTVSSSSLLIASGIAFGALAAADTAGVNTTTGVDAARNCVQNGFHYTATTAVGAHCYDTPDNSTVAPLAKVVSTKTVADLAAVQASSPLDPSHYLAQGSFATQSIAGAPLAPNSAAIATFVSDALPRIYLPSQFADWLRTGSNIGGGVSANDNIPIYTVDSSNPHEEFAQFASSDSRVTTYPKVVAMNSGKIPFPSWGKPSDGGDQSLAIYDVATGIWRSYFHVTKDANGVYQYASGGYWYGDTTTKTAGDRNYWLSLIQGTSSVIGISNELTQIGAQEVRNGKINHAVSVTFPGYMAGKTSFPAKKSDGQLDPATYPNAPQAGQRFTFPASFDVEAYIKANNIDGTTAAIMRAVKTYGGIVSDRNNWCMAFNFEHPYGIAATASKGQNVYQTDSALAAKINAMNINKFPWAQTAWVAPNYAAK